MADKTLLETAKENYKAAKEWWEPNQKAWLEDAKFRGGDQWPDEIKKFRSRPGAEKPCLVVDKLNQYVRQVVNDGRQNRPSVKVRPVEDGDVEVAEAYQGIIRHICDRSRADQAFDTALEHAVVGGFGFFRVVTEYAYENTFNQEICIKRVRNPLAVMLDPHAMEADGSDARYGFVVDRVPKDDFKKRYPNATKTDWEAEDFKDEWSDDKVVLVCEYFYKVDVPKKLHLLDDGTTIEDEDYQQAIKEGVQNVPKIVDTREIPDCEVKWCRMTGAEVLEENDWLGKDIPIIPVYGNEEDLEGKVTYSGLIRKAKDAQRLYNFSRSAFAERVAMTPKAPWLAAADQIADFPEWDDPNASTQVLRYKHMAEDGTVIPPPQRVSPSDIPGGFAEDMQLAEHDIQGALGMYNASLGEKSNEKSGKAIMARQREGDVGTFHYQDNQGRAIGFLGRILVDIIPKYIDSKRAIRILGEDGRAKMAVADPNAPQPYQKMGSVAIYNLNAGKYDVSVSSGPSYTTKRQEAADMLMQMVQANPQVMQIAGDIMIRALDMPYGEQLADRFKAMLPPQIQDLEQGEDPKVQAAVAPLKQQIQAAESGIQQRDQALQQQGQELQQLKADQAVAQAKAEADMYKAETDRMKAAAELQKQPTDPAQTEAMRLQYEDQWKKLEADTKVIVAAITAKQATDTAAISAKSQVDTAAVGAQAQQMQTEQAEPQEPAVDTNAALMSAIEGFTAAIQSLRQPRTILRDDRGNISGIQ